MTWTRTQFEWLSIMHKLALCIINYKHILIDIISHDLWQTLYYRYTDDIVVSLSFTDSTGSFFLPCQHTVVVVDSIHMACSAIFAYVYPPHIVWIRGVYAKVEAEKKSDKPGRFIEVLRCMHLTFYFNQPLYSAHIRPISQTASSCWKSLTIRLPTFNFSYTQSIVIASREEEAARGKNR